MNKIINYITGKVIISGSESIKKLAVKAKSRLAFADLSGIDLSGADLSDADLSDANFTGANLSGAVGLNRARLWNATGNGKEIKSEDVGAYRVVWTGDKVWIGCKCHSIGEWAELSPDDVESYSSIARGYWAEYKDVVLDLVTA